MLNISGVGFALPKTQISNQLLAQLSPGFIAEDFEKSSGLQTRYSALKPDYLESTKNSILTDSFANLEQSDLELGVKAVNLALSQAGIELSQIGLVLGETGTPFQTIPSQSQRVAGALGIKVKAYDILAGSASVALHLATLSSWRQDRLPEYILLIYSNLPSVFIDYSALTPDLARLGDAVAALVVSTRAKSKLSVLSAKSKTNYCSVTCEGISIFGPLQIAADTQLQIRAHLEAAASEALAICGRGSGKNYFLPSQISPELSKSLANELGFLPEETLVGQYGDSFSSSVFGPLSDIWDSLVSGDRIYIVMSGSGLQSGHVVLEVN